MKTFRCVLLLGLACASPACLQAEDSAPQDWANDLTPIAATDWNYQRAAHLLERAGFGGTPEEIEKLAKLTPVEAVDSLVDYEKVDDDGLPEFEPSGIYPNGHKLVGLDKVVVGALLTGKAYGVKATQEGELAYQPAVNEFYTLLISEHAEMRRAGQWWAERMLLTKRPMQEKLTLFWHDHLATSQEKLTNYELMLAQVETLRKHSNGNIREMLVAISQDPAMLIWLDNKDNVKGKPNENFAREIMELFTMGEGKGYTERDIRELARAFTGWKTDRELTVKDRAKFIDNPRLHDDGEKTFLGETGKFNGYDAIAIVLKQSATPRFLTGKLYAWFVRDDVAPEVQVKLADLLVSSKYDLKPLLKTILLSRDFYSQPSVGTQIKSPVHFAVSTYRKLGLQAIPGVPDYMESTGTLGQVLFYPPNVAGWPGGRSWINPATLLVRGNFAHTLLFPDPETYGAPDKVVAEGYRKIPLMFPQYRIQPRVWNAKTQRMEPVSTVAYDRYLAGINMGMMNGMDSTEEPKKSSNIATIAVESDRETKSKMTQLAENEKYNLAVGVYSGFVEAYNRVKPMPRNTADIDLVGMLRSVKVTTAEEAVDYFCRRLLSVDLSSERRTAIVEFLRNELGGDQISLDNKDYELALRRLVHLILSAPEYQLG